MRTPLSNFLNVITILLFLCWFIGYLLYVNGPGWPIHGLFVLAFASLTLRLWLARQPLVDGTALSVDDEAR